MREREGAHRQLLVPPVTLTRAEFVAILVERGIDHDDASGLFEALHRSDTRLVLEALDSLANRADRRTFLP